MECNNCQSLFSMIKALNENISSLLTGYGLLLNVVNDHEDKICQLRECSDKHEDCAKIDIVADCEIPIADNIDILSTISNVDISDENYNENISENLPLISTPGGGSTSFYLILPHPNFAFFGCPNEVKMR